MAKLVIIDPVPEGEWAIESYPDRLVLRHIRPTSIHIYK